MDPDEPRAKDQGIRSGQQRKIKNATQRTEDWSLCLYLQEEQIRLCSEAQE